MSFCMFDPFHIFHIPRSFDLSLTELDQRYGQLQNLCHPDRHPDPLNLSVFEKKSIEITQAYLILKNPIERALCLLKLAGMTTVYTHTETLMDMMALKEDLEDGRLDPESLKNMQQDTLENLALAFKHDQWENAQKHCYRYQFLSKLKVPTHVIATS